MERFLVLLAFVDHSIRAARQRRFVVEAVSADAALVAVERALDDRAWVTDVIIEETDIWGNEASGYSVLDGKEYSDGQAYALAVVPFKQLVEMPPLPLPRLGA
jgi:hypothetical protein